MKKNVLLLVFFCVFHSAMAQIKERYDHSNAAKTSILTAENITIVPDNTSPTVAFAAKELQQILTQVFGKELPIAQAPGQGTNIYLGFGKFAETQKMCPSQLGVDGFFIRSVGRDIVIAGQDDPRADIQKMLQRGGAWSTQFSRGTLFGVYEFLERYFDVRFYFPGEIGTVIPKKSRVELPALDVYERPDFTQRRYSAFWDGTYFEGENRDARIHPQKNLNLLRLRYETSYIPCCHGTNGFKLLDRFANTHPEYFALTEANVRRTDPTIPFAGHLCYSSGVTEVMYQDIKAYLQGKEASSRGLKNWTVGSFCKPYVDVMPQDSFYPCKCEKCVARYNPALGKEGMATELVWNTVIGWATRLKAEKVPGALSMMAYWPYRTLPKADIPDNVEVMLALSGPWTRDTAGIQRELGLLKQWNNKLKHKVHVWNYVDKVSSYTLPGIPHWTPVAVGKCYQRYAPYVFGVFMESESDRFLYGAMNHYMMCKVAWNNKLDVEAEMERFYVGMFGKAAPVMKKILMEYEDIWLTKIRSRMIITDLGPIPAIPSDLEIWTKIYSPAKLSQMGRDFAKAASLVPSDSVEARRIAVFRQEFLVPLEKASKAYLAKSKSVLGLKIKPGVPVQLKPFGQMIRKNVVNTLVRMKVTEQDMVISFDCEEPYWDKVLCAERNHDDENIWHDNSVEIFLDPAGERKTYYQIIVNSKGVVTDWACVCNGRTTTSDVKWESNAKVVITPAEKEVTIQVTIPLASFPKINSSGFPVNFGRNRILQGVQDVQVLYAWSPYASGFNDLENFGIYSDGRKEQVLDGGFDQIKPYATTNRHWGYRKGERFCGWIAGDYVKDRVYALQESTTFFSWPNSLKLVNMDGANLKVTSYNLKLKNNTTYRIGFAVKMDHVVPVKKGGGVGIILWDDANHWFPANPMTGTCDWSYVTFEHTTSNQVEQQKTQYLQLFLTNCKGTAWFDDVSIEELP